MTEDGGSTRILTVGSLHSKAATRASCCLVHDATEDIAMFVTMRLGPTQAGGKLSSCDEQGHGQAVLEELCLHAGSVLNAFVSKIQVLAGRGYPQYEAGV